MADALPGQCPVRQHEFLFLITESFPGDDPSLELDMVFGVREDLAMTHGEDAADRFSKGYVLFSGVTEQYRQL